MTLHRDERDDEPRDHDPRPRVNWPLVITISAIVIGWLAMAGADNRAIVSRVTALESQRAEDTKRLDRIEDKLDLLLQRSGMK